MSKLEKAKVAPGLYRRDQTRTNRDVSHDEITGMMVTSKLLKTNHANEIWNYLFHHFFIYNPNNINKYPIFHPAWIYFWGELVDAKWSKLLFPLAFINIILATREGTQQETSGKLLYFTLLKRDSWLFKIYKQRMIKIYGKDWVKSIFSIYFWTEPKNHPLIWLSERYNYESI